MWKGNRSVKETVGCARGMRPQKWCIRMPAEVGRSNPSVWGIAGSGSGGSSRFAWTLGRPRFARRASGASSVSRRVAPCHRPAPSNEPARGSGLLWSPTPSTRLITRDESGRDRGDADRSGSAVLRGVDAGRSLRGGEEREATVRGGKNRRATRERPPPVLSAVSSTTDCSGEGRGGGGVTVRPAEPGCSKRRSAGSECRSRG